KQTLGERVGAAHDLQWASGGSSINASRTLRDDVFQRYFSNLLVKMTRIVETTDSVVREKSVGSKSAFESDFSEGIEMTCVLVNPDPFDLRQYISHKSRVNL
ncbi:hypothetical protein, partial [Paraburkholderia sp. BR14320]|uniref:hypothetical protein n=1 Tax=unclassified Paraburkholderia TaxID=2615204 RepID=UPI0034CECEBF